MNDPITFVEHQPFSIIYEPWISVKDSLPPPDYNWMLVAAERFGTDEPWPWAIARYTDEGWEFFDKHVLTCPTFYDGVDGIEEEEISHWMEVNKPYQPKKIVW